MPAHKVTVSVTIPNPNVKSVMIEQWRRGEKGSTTSRTPEQIPGSPTTPMTQLDMGGTEWFAGPFNVHPTGMGGTHKGLLRIKAYDGAGGMGTMIACFALPRRRFPKPRPVR